MSMRASAARYARALLDVAITESDPDRAEQELAAFVDLVRQNPDLERTFGNPVVSAADKRAVVQQILDRLKPATPVGKLLVLLASRGRLALLPDLLDVYRERLMEHRNVLRAEVTTAVPLSPERTSQLQQRLAARPAADRAILKPRGGVPTEADQLGPIRHVLEDGRASERRVLLPSDAWRSVGACRLV